MIRPDRCAGLVLEVVEHHSAMTKPPVETAKHESSTTDGPRVASPDPFDDSISRVSTSRKCGAIVQCLPVRGKGFESRRYYREMRWEKHEQHWVGHWEWERDALYDERISSPSDRSWDLKRKIRGSRLEYFGLTLSMDARLQHIPMEVLLRVLECGYCCPPPTSSEKTMKKIRAYPEPVVPDPSLKAVALTCRTWFEKCAPWLYRNVVVASNDIPAFLNNLRHARSCIARFVREVTISGRPVWHAFPRLAQSLPHHTRLILEADHDGIGSRTPPYHHDSPLVASLLSSSRPSSITRLIIRSHKFTVPADLHYLLKCFPILQEVTLVEVDFVDGRRRPQNAAVGFPARDSHLTCLNRLTIVNGGERFSIPVAWLRWPHCICSSTSDDAAAPFPGLHHTDVQAVQTLCENIFNRCGRRDAHLSVEKAKENGAWIIRILAYTGHTLSRAGSGGVDLELHVRVPESTSTLAQWLRPTPPRASEHIESGGRTQVRIQHITFDISPWVTDAPFGPDDEDLAPIESALGALAQLENVTILIPAGRHKSPALFNNLRSQRRLRWRELQSPEYAAVDRWDSVINYIWESEGES